jgi:hypothetical protein
MEAPELRRTPPRSSMSESLLLDEINPDVIDLAIVAS